MIHSLCSAFSYTFFANNLTAEGKFANKSANLFFGCCCFCGFCLSEDRGESAAGELSIMICKSTRALNHRGLARRDAVFRFVVVLSIFMGGTLKSCVIVQPSRNNYGFSGRRRCRRRRSLHSWMVFAPHLAEMGRVTILHCQTHVARFCNPATTFRTVDMPSNMCEMGKGRFANALSGSSIARSIQMNVRQCVHRAGSGPLYWRKF